MKTVIRPKMRVRPMGEKGIDSYKRSTNLLELIRIADDHCDRYNMAYLEPIYKCIETPDARKDEVHSTKIERSRKYEYKKHVNKEIIYYEAHLISN